MKNTQKVDIITAKQKNSKVITVKINKTQISNYAIRIITGVLIATVGIIMLVKPETSLVTACCILGVAAAVKGVFKIIEGKKADNTGTVVFGIATLVLSCLLFSHPRFLLSVFPVVTGLVTAGYGIISLLIRKASTVGRKIADIILIAVGITIIIVPFKFAKVMTAVTGLALIIIGILSVISDFLAKKTFETAERNLLPDDGYTEVEFKDVDGE